MRLIVLAALLAAAPAMSGCEKVSDAAFGARVRAYLLAHPEVVEEAAIKLEAQRAAEADKQATLNIGRYRASLERDRRDFVANPNGKITVVEFFDYHCGYCKAAAPDVVKLIAGNPDVRFVFKELPILSPESDRAAALALAARDKGRYLSLYSGFYSVAKLDDDAMTQVITQEGLDPATLRADAATAGIQAHLNDNHKLARDLGIDGTPTFIVGTAKIKGGDFRALEAAIDKARKS